MAVIIRWWKTAVMVQHATQAAYVITLLTRYIARDNGGTQSASSYTE